MKENPGLQFLKSFFGFAQFRPHQEEIIKAICRGQDVFVVMPTGGGKSLCYQFPAVVLKGVCVVISPLLSLMKDQVDAACALGIRAATLNSTTDRSDFTRIADALEKSELDLLYISPERFNNPNFLTRLTNANVSFFAIDEAHCISQWGHQFRPDYLGLQQISEVFPKTPIAAFTATATESVAADIKTRLRLRNPLTVRASFNRPNLYYRVLRKEDLTDQLIAFLETVPGEPGIIYRGTRKKVEETAKLLRKKGFKVCPYHAGMSTEDRIKVQDAFVKDEIQIIVATIAFGMGIDKPNVRFVVHADLPKNIEGYYQETGRAGRDGAPAQCLLLFSYQDIVLLRSFIGKYEEPEVREATYQQLQEMIHFAETEQCRRKSLLRYFNEEYPESNCGNCDFCKNEIDRDDVTIDAQKALSAMQRTGNRFGINHLVEVLVGADTARIRQLHHNELPTYGVGKEKKKSYWRYLINALICKGAAEMTPNCDFPVPRVTRFGWQIMRGAETIQIAHLPKPQKKVEKRKPPKAIDLTPEDYRLFEILRKRRNDLAKERGLPSFYIFPEISLAQMALEKPKTADEMRDISGVGEKKMEAYGEIFLRLIVDHLTRTGE